LKFIGIVLKTIIKNKLTATTVFYAVSFIFLHEFHQLIAAIWEIKAILLPFLSSCYTTPEYWYCLTL